MVDFLSKHDFVVCVGQLPSEILTKKLWKLSYERAWAWANLHGSTLILTLAVS